MVDSTVLLVVRIFAAFGALALICSPSILMRQIHTQKHVGVASVIPLVMLAINSHVWMMYGYLAENYFPIFSCYAFGDVAALAYVAVYWRYTTERNYVARVITVAVTVITILSIYAILGGIGCTGQTRAEVAKTMGYIGDATAVCLYAAPMEKLFQVLKHKSATFINAHMVMASLTNNVMWFTYGILTANWIIIAPNILFIALNSSTLVLCIVFNPKTHPLHESFFANDDTPIEVSVELSPKTELLKVFEPGKGCGLDVTTEEAAIHEASVSYYETCWMEIGPSVESAARTRDQQHTRLNYFISFAEPY
ncbi:hypothetical protein PC118_g9814 [Phytophthora cactorum]|uniref:SWEET sugar transporter n=1 Tax=Phytophthora cactorum TaxID=29920 RepID=A0A8T0YNP0_9STRA|nr:hypothetical protein PC113_g18351 [Phytophthora cactorum]KAG2906569.1 hypothetical protein PC114_g11109 [Phytophthora cactorum]KAG2909685.1 hypothetical protein PC117_g19602 [Phytophthora cactorum]KAG2982775.1 hypothetical protein PC118_g9814 [Phytophthora cactorum]KAG3010152.1 hypothetical protein PC120_g15217 [Phytophthora cactorum]